MNLSGEYKIPASRERVWDALNDPAILAACIPGVESLEKHSDTEFTAKVTAKVGPVKASFSGVVNLLDLDPPNGYRITGEGQGGIAGFAKGGADVRLAEDGGDTTLTYEADAQVGGKLAQIGSRLVVGTARKMADEFFGRFAEQVGAADDTTELAQQSIEAADAPALPETEARPGIPPIAWIGATIVVVVLLVALLA